MKKSLLIISCSKSKTETPGVIPANERYTGGCFNIIDTAKREDAFPTGKLDIVIISAKYGFLQWHEKIENYNQKMDKKQAIILRPSVQENLKSFLVGKDYDTVCINVPKNYFLTLEDFDFTDYCDEVYIIKASGGYIKNSDMRKWIRGLCNS